MSDLLQTARQAALPGIWSQGVKLARDAQVTLEASSETELVLRVCSPERPVPATVSLYPVDAEWTCDCSGRVDPCAHVVAAVIAWSQARQAGQELAPAADTRPVVGYRFKRQDGRVEFARVLVEPSGREEVIKGSLAGLIGHGPGSGVHLSQEDLDVDRIVAGWRPGFLAPERTRDLLRLLASARDVKLDGAPIGTSGEELLPEASVEDDAAGGILLRIQQNPHTSELVWHGVARAGDTLLVLGETETTGMRLERLPLVRTFSREELGTFVQQVLPELTKKLSVSVKTNRLPVSSRGDPPRIAFNPSQEEHTLSVLPLLVYGDPPRARIDNGELVHLGGTVPARDLAAEKALVLRLREELNLVPGRRVDFDGADAIRFAERLRRWQGSGQVESALGETALLIPRLALDGDRFELAFETEQDPARPNDPVATAPAEAVLRSWRDGLGLVPLSLGGWAQLPEAWLERFGHVVMDLLAARREDGTVPQLLLPVLAELCQDLDLPPPPELERLRPLFSDFSGIPPAPLPAGLTATLRDYQRRGVDWLSFLRDAGLGAVLADDMGLGKTLQTLCALRGRALVVCPKSVVFNWASEIGRFLPRRRVSIYHGPRRQLEEQADITLTTYAVLRLDTERLAAEPWDAVVLDEAQAIKNPDSQAARAAYALKAKFRAALSGTPVENRLEELWSLSHFTNPGLLGGRRDFADRYEAPIAGGNAEAARRLHARIRPFLLRRMKREVAPELPPRTDVILYCELEATERTLYEAIRAAGKREVVSHLERGGNPLAALELLLRLRQAACHPALIPGQTAATSSKVERLLYALRAAAADGHKALVFSQWTSLLDLIAPELEQAGIPFNRLDGKTRDRARVVSDFQSSEGPPVMLVSLKAGGTGLNLTAADHVFLLDPWWNPKAEDQAADRAHRIGQARPVMVYRMVARDTVDEGILSLQERKRAIADVALGATDQARALTREDLLFLLD